MAVLLAAFSLTGCGDEVAGLGDGSDPGNHPNLGTFTVTYEAGNGDGDTVTQLVSKGVVIQPGGSAGFTAPEGYAASMVFAGWNDGTFTYAADDPYLITNNVTFQARWGFTSETDVAEYFVSANKNKYTVGNNILLVACDKEETVLTETVLKAIIGKIPSTSSPTVELDLSASKLDVSETEGLSVQKLILSRGTTAITTLQWKPTAHEVSGLYVASIGGTGFEHCDTLEAVYFPKATTIAAGVFYECDALEKADFPEATTIGTGAFENCDKLVTANFPKATNIKQYAFNNCTNLKTITIGAGCGIDGANSDSPDSIGDDFKTAYENANRKAGTYTRDAAADKWTGPAS